MDSGVAGFTKTRRRHEDINYDNIPWAVKNNDYASYDDHDGHGTFIIGEIAAIMNNYCGVAGLMPDVNIIPVKIFDREAGSIAEIIDTLNYIVDEDEELSIDVVSMSVGSDYYSKSFQKAINRAAGKGMILVASAGNGGTRKYSYPASYDKVISVGAVDEFGDITDYSQHNDMVDIAAPGDDIAGLDYSANDGYCYMSGTSMAVPIVSAMAAMAKSMNHSIDYDSFMDLVRETSQDAGEPGYDTYYGFGIADFAGAYEYMLEYNAREREIYVTLSNDTYPYTGYQVMPDVTVRNGNGFVLKKGTDYTVDYEDNIGVGEATVIVTGIGTYSGRTVTMQFEILNAEQFRTLRIESPFKVRKSDKTIKKSRLKSGSVTFSPLKVTEARGKVTYSMQSGSRSVFKLNRNNGKLTVRKGTSKGTYTVRIRVTDEGDDYYIAKSITKKIKVKIN